MAHEASPDRIAKVRQVGLDVDDAGRKNEHPRVHRRCGRLNGEGAAGDTLDGFDAPFDDPRAITQRLRTQAAEQLRSADPVGEAGQIMGTWNERRPAGARVDDDDRAAEAREIDRGYQPGGAAPHDQCIDVHD